MGLNSQTRSVHSGLCTGGLLSGDCNNKTTVADSHSQPCWCALKHLSTLVLPISESIISPAEG